MMEAASNVAWLQRRVLRVLPEPVICIVDDDEALRDGLVALLRSSGQSALGFPSAEALLEAPVMPTLRCLITDLHMPGMNGLMLAKTLRERGLQAPTILLSAFLTRQAREAAASLGIDLVLEKPVDPDHLLSQLSELASGDRLRPPR